MASRDQQKAAANLLRQSLRDLDDSCPGPDILAAYFERSLDEQESARYELHLSECGRCREQLAVLSRASLTATSDAPPRQSSSYWGWLWDWRRLAPIAAGLIVVAVWMARRPVSRHASEPPQLVAMSQALNTPAASSELQATPGAAAGAPHLTTRLGNKEKQPAKSPGGEADARGRKKNQQTAGDLGLEAALSRSPVSGQAAPPAPAPSKSDSSTLQANAGEMTVNSGAGAAVLEPPPVETKSRQSSAAARAMTQTLALQTADRLSVTGMIATPDPKVLWRIAHGGLIELSQDGGISWQKQLVDVSAQLTSGSAPSEKVCWLVGRGGVIVRTNNAKDWERISPPVAADFVAITAQGASTATVTTADGRRFTTNDGGVHWVQAP
jgi:Photosynthesis system II assembly factor YCF48